MELWQECSITRVLSYMKVNLRAFCIENTKSFKVRCVYIPLKYLFYVLEKFSQHNTLTRTLEINFLQL